MFRPVPEHGDDPPRVRRRKRRLRTIQTLPTLLTLGNLFFGFMALYFCGLEMRELGANRIEVQATVADEAGMFEGEIVSTPRSFLVLAFWMILAAGVCDALDGRVARKTGAASRFGEQLDSLADMVSFGAAPALMMITLIHRELLHGGIAPFGFDRYGQLAVLISAIYICCAGLRLARFNVEASVQETSHEGFQGLPSPGAAAAVVTTVYLHDHLLLGDGWTRGAYVIAAVLPLLMVGLALLMVSRVQYRHFVSALLRRRPFEHVIVVLLAIPLLWIYTEFALAALAWAFVATGPIGRLSGWVRGVPAAAPSPEAEPAEDGGKTGSAWKKRQA